MEARVNAQITALTDEISTLRQEVIQIKAAHATLHQGAVDSNNQHHAAYGEQAQRIVKLEQHLEDLSRSPPASGGAFGSGKGKDLIEPKQVTVETFTGAFTDSRSKFLSWTERVKDRVGLFDPNLVQAMNATE